MSTSNVRHNTYGVDISGPPGNVGEAMHALNTHADLLAALDEIEAMHDSRNIHEARERARAALAAAKGGAA